MVGMLVCALGVPAALLSVAMMHPVSRGVLKTLYRGAVDVAWPWLKDRPGILLAALGAPLVGPLLAMLPRPLARRHPTTMADPKPPTPSTDAAREAIRPEVRREVQEGEEEREQPGVTIGDLL